MTIGPGFLFNRFTKLLSLQWISHFRWNLRGNDTMLQHTWKIMLMKQPLSWHVLCHGIWFPLIYFHVIMLRILIIIPFQIKYNIYILRLSRSKRIYNICNWVHIAKFSAFACDNFSLHVRVTIQLSRENEWAKKDKWMNSVTQISVIYCHRLSMLSYRVFLRWHHLLLILSFILFCGLTNGSVFFSLSLAWQRLTMPKYNSTHTHKCHLYIYLTRFRLDSVTFIDIFRML